MKKDITVAAVQFEHQSADHTLNLQRIAALTRRAAERGAQVVSFHECCVTGYTFLQTLTRDQLAEIAEPVPNGPSTERLIQIAAENDVVVLAGLLEVDGKEFFNTYVCVDRNGMIARHRKIHAFVNPHLSSGSEFTLFELAGCKCGILICYDNNVIENVRATTLLGAEIIFMPHVTGCLPSAMPGRGLVDVALWHNRHRDPVALRQELDGPKGRGWLMKWLPARAFDNGIYAVFSNPIGIDDDQVRNGNAMIVDPNGEIMSECRELGDDIAVAVCTPEKLEKSSGKRYIRARRVELYDKLVEPPAEPPVTKPSWDLKFE